MNKLKILLSIAQVANCGVGWYRQYLPLKKLEEKGLIELKSFGYDGGKTEAKDEFRATIVNGRLEDVKISDEYVEACKWADIIYICRDERPAYIAVHGGLKNFLKEKYGMDKRLVVDIDDYVQFVRPHSPGYLSFHPNSIFNNFNFKLLNIVDEITTSTEYLKKVYVNENKNIFVCPNSLDIKERDRVLDTVPEVPKKGGEIRIGWAGSGAHYENMKQIQRPIHEILRKYPNVTFCYTGLFGDLFKWDDVKDRVFTVGFVSLDEWPKKLRSMGLDIALAPLADNHFNRAKSNLRVLEYWNAKFPVIASPVEPYKFIKNREDGLLAMEEIEWFENICDLIENPDKRKMLIENGYKRLREEYDIERNCMIWYQALTNKQYEQRKCNNNDGGSPEATNNVG